MLYSFYRIFKFAGQNFWRNIWLSLTTIVIITLALVSVNILATFQIFVQKAVAAVQDKIDVSVYFQATATEAQIDEVKSYLLTLSQVKSADYIPPSEALARFQTEHRNDPKILEALQELEQNPFLPALNIKTHRLGDYPLILGILDDPQYSSLIQEKNFEDHRVIIEKIDRIAEKVQRIGLFVILIFVGIAILIVFNAIRVAIYTHREEIGIMRLVGASNWFVRLPFLMESVFYSIIAWLFGIAAFLLLLFLFQPYFSALLDAPALNLLTYFQQNFLQIFGLELIVVILLNIATSSLAIGKYLKV